MGKKGRKCLKVGIGGSGSSWGKDSHAPNRLNWFYISHGPVLSRSLDDV